MAYDLVVIAKPKPASFPPAIMAGWIDRVVPRVAHRLIVGPMAASTSQGRQRCLGAVTRVVAGSRGEGDQANATGGR
jgi:hypothetical protein